MKIYNKRGLFFAVIWTALGAFSAIINILSQDSSLPQRIKGVVIAIVLIIMGINGFTRAFSKQATREDIVEKQDERNSLLQLKTKSLTLKVLYGCLILITAGGLVAYGLTSNLVWIPTVTVTGGLLGFLLIVEIVVEIHYERHM
ncbi:MAG: hypothetical protein LKE46_13145 [Clostridium sp.]|jgi:cytochrome c biogenesis protein CcdA|uniref:hypothetical protein n=1 Tax=Clostridium sp. TaxID=1506 RepID=UPI0025BC7F20|nr:hypothetical protein [Clostridium sp.]MCH3965205.1 hypothetical protein [Clostridium sp.]MCI1714425.1 hypothetical protein [Clostridium sp.]MCI1798687.1 hypothetical protein [Clostridium sp.]MCI1812582.1 hypothetical protein [Clostridium sp.]MCI1869496.1 hypothetical protein [Clostridium sp.]